MATTTATPRIEDQRVFLHGATWNDYERILGIRGEASTPRVAYLKGVLELMTPSREHEAIAKMIGRLLEAYAEERGIALNGYKSWTLKKEVKARGAEADECYCLGRVPADEEVPDLAIEVIWTSGGIDKLKIYRGLGVPEVWFWEDGVITVHALSEAGEYEQHPASVCLPDLDLPTVALQATRKDQTQTVREFRKTLQDG